MLKKVTYGLATALVGISMFASCGGGGDDAAVVNITREETEDSISENVIQTFSLIRANIPNPSEVFLAVSDAGVNYDKGLMNSSSKASGYSSTYQAALNLGVFGADLGYAAMYNQNQDVIEYSKQVSSLAQKVGVESAFNQEFFEYMQDNLGTGDTMTLAINEAFTRAERNLHSNERLSVSALLITGGWIEGLYIATKCAKSAGNNSILNQKVWEQVFSIKYVIELLQNFENNADCKKALEELKEMGELYKEFGNKPKLEKEDIDIIETKVTSLRSKVI